MTTDLTKVSGCFFNMNETADLYIENVRYIPLDGCWDYNVCQVGGKFMGNQ